MKYVFPLILLTIFWSSPSQAARKVPCHGVLSFLVDHGYLEEVLEGDFRRPRDESGGWRTSFDNIAGKVQREVLESDRPILLLFSDNAKRAMLPEGRLSKEQLGELEDRIRGIFSAVAGDKHITNEAVVSLSVPPGISNDRALAMAAEGSFIFPNGFLLPFPIGGFRPEEKRIAVQYYYPPQNKTPGTVTRLDSRTKKSD